MKNASEVIELEGTAADAEIDGLLATVPTPR